MLFGAAYRTIAHRSTLDPITPMSDIGEVHEVRDVRNDPKAGRLVNTRDAQNQLKLFFVKF